MNIIPSNQTLILAGERVPSNGARRPALDSGRPAAATAAVLKRVTIVTTRTDDTLVYVGAGYAHPSEGSHDDVIAAQPQSAATAALSSQSFGDSTSAHAPAAALVPLRRPLASRDLFGNQRNSSRGAGLYAQTQRLLSEAADTALLDVHA